MLEGDPTLGSPSAKYDVVGPDSQNHAFCAPTAGCIDDETFRPVFREQQPIANSASPLGRDPSGVLLGSQRLVHLHSESASQGAQVRMGVECVLLTVATV